MLFKAITVFVALFALDFVWARYTNAMTEKRATIAGNYAAAIIVLSGFGITQYASEPILLIPAAAGAWLGTAFAICRSR